MPEPAANRDTIVVAQHAGRLDVIVQAACPTLSRRLVRRLIDDGVIRVEGRRVARGAHVVAGARISVPDADRLTPRHACHATTSAPGTKRLHGRNPVAKSPRYWYHGPRCTQLRVYRSTCWCTSVSRR